MKTWIPALLAALVMSVPFAAAETGARLHAEAISSWDLKFKQFGQGFADFGFGIRHFLTFDEQAKLELLRERNTDLKARQAEWIELKEAAFAKVEANNTAEGEKRAIIKSLQAEHEAIIKEHLKVTAEIREIQLNARARGHAQLAVNAEERADECENSGLSEGLRLSVGQLKLLVNEDVETGLTEDQVRARIQAEFGISGAEVSTVTRDETTFYVVAGTQAKFAGDQTLTRNLEIWIDAETGAVASVDIVTHLDTGIKARSVAGLEIG